MPSPSSLAGGAFAALLSKHLVAVKSLCYALVVPKLWSETIEAHRRAVRDATIDTTAGLVARHGLRGVTMSQIAAQTGIGRATLYKYFPDVEAIMVAWHQRQIGAHLHELVALADEARSAYARLATVLEGYALMLHQHHGSDLAALLHQGQHVARAHRHLHEFLRRLLAEASAADAVRDDASPAELATYCLHAVAAAAELPSKTAVRRLVAVTLAGLRPES